MNLPSGVICDGMRSYLRVGIGGPSRFGSGRRSRVFLRVFTAWSERLHDRSPQSKLPQLTSPPRPNEQLC